MPILLLFLAGGTARAADGPPSPGERIANALRSSPVYVDKAYEGAVPPSRQRELEQQIAATGLPVKVVLVPLTKGDSFDGEADTLASVVHDRLDLREFVLITTDGRYTDYLNGYEWPSDTHQTRDAVAAAGFLDETRDAGLADLTSKAVELVAEGNGTETYEKATRSLDTPRSEEPSPAEEEKSGWPTTGTALLALLLTACAALFLVRRHRTARPTARTPSPSVFKAARAADESALRRRAEAEVIALGEAVLAAEVTDTRALDAYAEAGKVLDAARDAPDLAGVLALAAEGRDALPGTGSTSPPLPGTGSTSTPLPGTGSTSTPLPETGTRSTPLPDAASEATPLPLCFFNPLHGRAERRATWRPPGRPDRARVAVCATCATALRARRAPEVLTGTDGVPYLEVPGSVWAETGYGSLLSDGDTLSARVARGDFTRTTRSRPDRR
ncbi:hypothetical protein ACIPSE_04900 [Streptomyces sp. NPDC090106]|uniref:hypothetical protein n=1 Tax=Streptomyces sp. NPDC090106 TaxID=3365946 RepID=UPI0037F98985